MDIVEVLDVLGICIHEILLHAMLAEIRKGKAMHYVEVMDRGYAFMKILHLKCLQRCGKEFL